MVIVGCTQAFAIVGGTVTRDVGIMPVSMIVEDTGIVKPSTCADLKSNGLRYRASDATTNGEVTVLQNFLINNGFLTKQANGYFGLSTLASVKQLQQKLRIAPTGYVGTLTKAKIKEMSCSSPVTSSESASLAPQAISEEGVIVNSNTVKPRVCTMEARFCPNGTMMARNTETCEWLPGNCGETTSKVPPRYLYGYDPLPPVRPSTTPVVGQPLGQRVPSTPSQAPTQAPDAFSVPAPAPVVQPAPAPAPTPLPARTVSTTSRIIPIYGSTTIDLPGRDVVRCTMMVKLCPDGSSMPRDASCGWHPEQCPSTNNTVGGIQCSTDPFSGKQFCGTDIPRTQPVIRAVPNSFMPVSSEI